MRIAYTFILLLLALLGQVSSAAETKNGHGTPQDVAAIRAASQAVTEAFNKHDAKALAELWTEDGDFTTGSGRRFVGRAAISAAYEELFKRDSQTRLSAVVESIRLLSDTAAIEDGRNVVEPPPPGAPGVGKYTAVYVKQGDKWLMSTVRETWIETSSAYQRVADLEWLIGDWIAEDRGVKTESSCRWIANKSFVERSYTVTAVDGTTSSGVQLIGWNARAGHVQSWNFSPDGGHAVGLWSPIEGGWSAEIVGATGSGAATTAVNTLRRLDDNAYVWQSTRRTIDGQPLPDTDEVVMRRRADSKQN